MARFLSEDIWESEILDAIPHRAGGTSHSHGQTGARERRRQNLIQCRQCSEEYAPRTVICPRCNRVNDRSLVIRGLKFFALVLFVCTVTWVVRVAAGAGDPSALERTNLRPSFSPGAADLPELKF